MDKVQFDIKGIVEEIDIIIEVRENEDIQTLKGAAWITGRSDTLPYMYATIKPEALTELVKDERIIKIWKDEDVEAVYGPCFYNPLLNDSIPLQGIDQIWDDGFKGKGIVIGIADTGITDHPDLAGRILKRGNTIGNSHIDGHGHGTAVASCAGGDGKVYKGVAPECSFISVKVLDDNGSGKLSSVINGVNWLMRQDLHHVDIINLSLGSRLASTDGSDPLSKTCALAISKGIVVVVAAGNSGPRPGSIGIPACREEVIAVGASDKSDRLAFFSSKGPTTDHRIKPDITATGKDMVMARAPNTKMGTPIDKDYTRASGTSFASPVVAGLCALLLQKNKKLSPANIKEILMDTAKKIRV